MVINGTTSAPDASMTFSFPTWNHSAIVKIIGVLFILSFVKNISLLLRKMWLSVLLPVSHAVVGLKGVLIHTDVVIYYSDSPSLNCVSASVP